MDAASRVGEIPVPPSPMANLLLTWKGAVGMNGKTPDVDSVAGTIGETCHVGAT